MADALVGTRLLGTPPNYNSMRSEWSLLNFTLRTYLGATNGNLLRYATNIDGHNDPLHLSRMTKVEQTNSRTLVDILAKCLAGSSRQLAMNVDSMNGLEAQRFLAPHLSGSPGVNLVTSQIYCCGGSRVHAVRVAFKVS